MLYPSSQPTRALTAVPVLSFHRDGGSTQPMLGFFLWRWSILIDICLIYITYIYIVYIHISIFFNVQISSFQILTWIPYPWGFPTKEKGIISRNLQISIHPNNFPHFSRWTKIPGQQRLLVLAPCDRLEWHPPQPQHLMLTSLCPWKGPGDWRDKKFQSAGPVALGFLKKLGLQLGKSLLLVNFQNGGVLVGSLIGIFFKMATSGTTLYKVLSNFFYRIFQLLNPHEMDGMIGCKGGKIKMVYINTSFANRILYDMGFEY